MSRKLAKSRIVVGVDGSAASAAAVRWAVREAKLRHVRVHLVCSCHSDFRLRAPYVTSSWLESQDQHYAAAQKMLAAMTELALRHLQLGWLTSELVNEPPARALLDRAVGAEMLVLGTTRPAAEPGGPLPAMGPVARACLRLAHCPVVVVAPDDQLPGSGTARRHRQNRGSGAACLSPGGASRDSQPISRNLDQGRAASPGGWCDGRPRSRGVGGDAARWPCRDGTPAPSRGCGRGRGDVAAPGCSGPAPVHPPSSLAARARR
jgi:nucleotide-binding universal stress UspA family protein